MKCVRVTLAVSVGPQMCALSVCVCVCYGGSQSLDLIHEYIDNTVSSFVSQNDYKYNHFAMYLLPLCSVCLCMCMRAVVSQSYGWWVVHGGSPILHSVQEHLSHQSSLRDT